MVFCVSDIFQDRGRAIHIADYHIEFAVTAQIRHNQSPGAKCFRESAARGSRNSRKTDLAIWQQLAVFESQKLLGATRSPLKIIDCRVNLPIRDYHTFPPALVQTNKYKPPSHKH